MRHLPLFDHLEDRISLESIQKDLGECVRCGLSRTRRTIVFGQGNPRARLMFVGEAPGEVEDESGIAFAGRAGILLTELLEEFGWSREAIYIANCIKCRPPQNRDPEPEELKVCSPFLEKQIFSIRPEVIVALGKYSAQMLIGEEVSISRMRGRIWHTKYGRIVPTYHPAYILRNPTEVSKIREDFQLAMDFLHR